MGAASSISDSTFGFAGAAGCAGCCVGTAMHVSVGQFRIGVCRHEVGDGQGMGPDDTAITATRGHGWSLDSLQ